MPARSPKPCRRGGRDDVGPPDYRTTGQVLLRLDSAQLEGAVQRAEAALNQAEAQETNQHTNELRAQRDYDRLVALRATTTAS
jgi:multidrug efflux pump subunit AcrA (membrane-fusion protein)